MSEAFGYWITMAMVAELNCLMALKEEYTANAQRALADEIYKPNVLLARLTDVRAI